MGQNIIFVIVIHIWGFVFCNIDAIQLIHIVRRR